MKYFLWATGKGQKLRMIKISRVLLWLRCFCLMASYPAAAQSPDPGISKDHPLFQAIWGEDWQQQLQKLIGPENWSYMNQVPLAITRQQVGQAVVVMGYYCRKASHRVESGPGQKFKETCPYGFAAIIDQNQQQLKGVMIGQMVEAAGGEYVITESFITGQGNVMYKRQQSELPGQQGCKWLVQGVRPELLAQQLLQQIFHLSVDYGC